MNDHLTTTIAGYYAQRKEVAAVYLFGSFAYGNPGPSSDLDLGLLFEPGDRQSILQQLDQHLVELSRLLRRDLHLVPLNLAGEVLLKQVFAKGRCIIINNPKQHALFEMIAYAKIADFGYHRQRFQTGFARKIMQA
jgi:predicted nucleotidyltransferase